MKITHLILASRIILASAVLLTSTVAMSAGYGSSGSSSAGSTSGSSGSSMSGGYSSSGSSTTGSSSTGGYTSGGYSDSYTGGSMGYTPYAATSTMSGGTRLTTFVVHARDHRFYPTELRVEPGQRVQVLLFNDDRDEHNFKVVLPSGEVAIPQNVAANEARFVDFDAPGQAGQHEFYCPVDNHHQEGMRGTLIVGSAGGTTSTGATSTGTPSTGGTSTGGTSSGGGTSGGGTY
ncbi:MAG: cupredoxin domain-containing protein [Armatimonadota bacterium]|nr:cupredoxin domain-containing protein [Armatimonadota bacterium]